MSPPSWPQVRHRNLKPIKNHLIARGYRVLSLTQPWRHVIGHLAKNDQAYFFKLAAHPSISAKTQTEISWYRYAATQMHPQAPFQVPTIYHTGLYRRRLSYFIASDFGFTPIATKYPPDPKHLSRHLTTIARVAHQISTFNPLSWSVLHPDSKPETLTENVITKGYYEPSHVRSAQLFKCLKQLDFQPIFTMSHGDFVPWHMYRLPHRQIGLVDAEHARVRPRHYDLVYCYLRLRANIDQPRLAQHLLKAYQAVLPPGLQARFWLDLKPLMLAKTINLYWEVLHARLPNDLRDLSVCDALADDILNDQLI